MNAQHQTVRQRPRQLIISLIAACLIPAALPPMSAQAAPGYRPPRRSSGQRTESTGTRSAGSRSGNLRGCAKDLAIPLTMLMPNHTANTTMAQPPLFLYVAKPKQLSVAFYELPRSGGRRLLWRTSVKTTQAGIVQLPFPSTSPKLEVGKTYAWTAAIVCDPQNPNELVSAIQSKLRRVAPSAWLQSKLKTAKTSQRRAKLFAGSSYWVDTINATAEALATAEDDSAEQDLLSLLKQIGLTDIVKREQAANNTPSQTGNQQTGQNTARNDVVAKSTNRATTPDSAARTTDQPTSTDKAAPQPQTASGTTDKTNADTEVTDTEVSKTKTTGTENTNTESTNNQANDIEVKTDDNGTTNDAPASVKPCEDHDA